jgi:hypothetical protein
MDMEIHPFSGRNGNSLPRKAGIMHGPLTGRKEDAMMAKTGKDEGNAASYSGQVEGRVQGRRGKDPAAV